MRILITILFASFMVHLSFAQSIETGKASFYADKFEGKSTASGEPYNSKVFTAAHRTLPFNTQVLVTNNQNGKSVIVRVNDRGPHVDGRIIDLSKSAAEYIEIINAGVADVEIQALEGQGVVTSAPTTTGTTVVSPPTSTTEVITPAPTTTQVITTPPTSTTSVITPTPVTTGGFSDMPTTIINSKTIGANFAVQLGSFRDLNNLNIQLAKYKGKSFGYELNIYETWKGGKKLYKILVGPYNTRREAEAKKQVITSEYQIDSFVFSVK